MNKKPIQKEILSFFSNKTLLKILKYNNEFRKEFNLNFLEIDELYYLNNKIENNELYVKIINNFKNSSSNR